MSKPYNDVSLTRRRIRHLLSREPGSLAAIARELGITRQTVGQVLSGRSVSARVMEIATARALQILATANNGTSAKGAR